MTDLFSFTYVYGNGDAYSGYGYASANTYSTGQYLGYGTNKYNNETPYEATTTLVLSPAAMTKLLVRSM